MKRSLSIGLVVMLQLLAIVAIQLWVIRVVGIGGETI